jgi:hypothetical protein
MTVLNGNQRLRERQLNAAWLLAGVLLFVANREADRRERVRMDSFRSRLTDLAKIAETIRKVLENRES